MTKLKVKLLKLFGKIAPILFLIFVLIFIIVFFISLLFILNQQDTNLDNFFQSLIVLFTIIIVGYLAYLNIESNNDISTLITASNIIWVLTIGFMAAIMGTVILTFVLNLFF
ncbi:MAG: hypothetical protein LAT82_03745 [Nanoarchaeota archaeon]|nr:hypothetical protein [Nanoarchaeota archaeon]